jgi:transposase
LAFFLSVEWSRSPARASSLCRTRTRTLTPRQRRTLRRVHDLHRQPYLREKAAALLKVADGWTVTDVARHGLLKPRSRNTVTAWLDRYQARGVAGLKIKAGRGRKPAFSPRGTDPLAGPLPPA